MTNDTVTDKPLQVQAGRRYNQKNGDITGPMDDTKDGSHHPFHNPLGGWFGTDGKANTSPASIDLISEYIEPTAEPQDEWEDWQSHSGPVTHGLDRLVEVLYTNGDRATDKRRWIDWARVAAYSVKKEPEVRKYNIAYFNESDGFYHQHAGDLTYGVRPAIITLTDGKLDIDWADE